MTSRRRRGPSFTPSPRPAPTARDVTRVRSRGPLVDFDFRTAWDARNLGLVVVPVEAREAVAVHLLEGFVVGGHGLLLGCDTSTRGRAAGSLSPGGWGCARPETPGFVVAVLQRRRCDAQTTADESFARLREYSLGFWCSSQDGLFASASRR